MRLNKMINNDVLAGKPEFLLNTILKKLICVVTSFAFRCYFDFLFRFPIFPFPFFFSILHTLRHSVFFNLVILALYAWKRTKHTLNKELFSKLEVICVAESSSYKKFVKLPKASQFFYLTRKHTDLVSKIHFVVLLRQVDLARRTIQTCFAQNIVMLRSFIWG